MNNSEISNSTMDDEPPVGVSLIQIVASIVMFLISTSGIVFNAYCFVKMIGRERFKTVFHLLNRARMISNIIILAVFLIWAVPCTLLGYTYLPHEFNQFFGQMAGWGAYWMGPATQFCISISRFIAGYFPFFYRRIENTRSAVILIVICVIYSAILFGMGMRDGCSFEFVAELISFLPIGECAMGFDTFINVTFAGFFVITTILNTCTAVKILRVIRHISTTNDASMIHKERKNWKLLAQNTIENFLYFFDTVVIKIPVPWYNEEWYQFVINVVVWQGHVMVDGLILLIYNRELLSSSRSGIWVSSVSRVPQQNQGTTRSTEFNK